MNRYAFINADSIVVQVIAGDLNAQQQSQFLSDYSAVFGAVAVVAVEPDIAVWIGGLYTDGQFLPPVMIEGTSEELLPPEVPSDSIPS